MAYGLLASSDFSTGRGECQIIGGDVAEFKEEKDWRLIEYYKRKWHKLEAKDPCNLLNHDFMVCQSSRNPDRFQRQ